MRVTLVVLRMGVTICTHLNRVFLFILGLSRPFKRRNCTLLVLMSLLCGLTHNECFQLIVVVRIQERGQGAKS